MGKKTFKVGDTIMFSTIKTGRLIAKQYGWRLVQIKSSEEQNKIIYES